MGYSELTPSKEKWLEVGYKDFATYGPDKLSINHISKEVGVSRASFYHHFGDMDIFIDELLARHWNICLEYNRIGKHACKQLIPDQYDLLAQFPIPLKFSHQLFRNRHIPRLNYLFVKSYEASARAFALELFSDHLDLDYPQQDLYGLWLTLGEAWYSRLDPDDLSARTLERNAVVILNDLSQLIGSGLYARLGKVQ